MAPISPLDIMVSGVSLLSRPDSRRDGPAELVLRKEELGDPLRLAT